MRDSTANYNFRTFRAVAHSWNSKALLTGFFLYYTTEIIKSDARQHGKQSFYNFTCCRAFVEIQ